MIKSTVVLSGVFRPAEAKVKSVFSAAAHLLSSKHILWIPPGGPKAMKEKFQVRVLC